MPENTSRRRIISRPTAIAVGRLSNTVLAQEAAATGINSFRRFEGNGLSTQVQHPVNTGPSGLVDVTQDGSPASAYQSTLSWTGKGVYDNTPGKRRVQWMGKGVGDSNNDWPYNTLAIYDEENNSWSAKRGYKHLNDVPYRGKTAGSSHIFDNNAIDVAGRRHYKKALYNNSRGASGLFYVYNLDTEQQEDGIPPPSGDTGAAGFGPADFVPTRGASGRLWYANGTSTVGAPRICEFDVATATWLYPPRYGVPAGSFPDIPSNFAPGNNGGVMSYNPRAFGGVGGVLVAGGGVTTVYTVRLDSMAVASSTCPVAVGLSSGGNGRICRDPKGDGWLFFAKTTRSVYRFDGTTWTSRTTFPSEIRTDKLFGALFYIVVPIDDYGVVWLIASRPMTRGTSRAWLYKP